MTTINSIPLKLCVPKSSNVHKYGYDEPSKTLAVQFVGGTKVHHYAGVLPEQFAAFDKAESKGRFHAEHFKGLPFKHADLPPATGAEGETA